MTCMTSPVISPSVVDVVPAIDACPDDTSRRSSRRGGVAATPVSVALIGCGTIAQQTHLPILAGHERVRVAALVDPDEQRARRLAVAYGVPMVCRDIAELAPGSIEAALLAT